MSYKPFRIVYACDDNYAALTAISAGSLLACNPGCEIILLGYKLKDESVELIRSRVLAKGGRLRVLDVTPAVRKLEASGVESYVSYAVYSRIFIPDLMREETGRVLYLDCDTLVVDALDELFNTDLTEHPLALAPDVIHPAYKRVISLPQDKPYYNTGVLLFDLDQWRTKRCTERLLDELKHPHGRNPLGDQDIIVRTLNDDILPLHRRWNFLSQYLMLGAKDSPAIYHFSGNTFGRPWFTSSKHPIRKRYQEAARSVGLEATTEQTRRMSLSYKVQYWLYKALPRVLFKVANRFLCRLHILLTYGK